MGLFDELFGERDAFSAEETILQNSRAADDLTRLGDRARQDLIRVFPAAQQSLTDGVNQALGIYSQAIPEQMSVRQQGNMNAQNTQATGLSMIQRALMGLPVEMDAAELRKTMPRSVDYNVDFLDQQAPVRKLADELGINLDPFFSRQAAWQNPGYTSDYNASLAAGSGPTFREEEFRDRGDAYFGENIGSMRGQGTSPENLAKVQELVDLYSQAGMSAGDIAQRLDSNLPGHSAGEIESFLAQQMPEQIGGTRVQPEPRLTQQQYLQEVQRLAGSGSGREVQAAVDYAEQHPELLNVNLLARQLGVPIEMISRALNKY